MLGSEAVTVPPLADLQRRRSAKWREYPADVLPLHIAETDFDLALPVRAVLEEAVRWSDTGYPSGAAEAAAALAHFADQFWAWGIDPDRVGLTSDVGVGCGALLIGQASFGEMPIFERHSAVCTGALKKSAGLTEIVPG